MSTSSNVLIDDVFYIPTVPRYKDFGAEMDDTLGDYFFELLTINGENIAPERKFEEAAKPSVRPNKRFSIDRKPSIKEVNEAKEESVTKVKAQPRPVRRSLMRQISKEPTQDAEVNVDVGEELPTELKELIPKVKAQPRPVRRSIMVQQIPKEKGKEKLPEKNLTGTALPNELTQSVESVVSDKQTNKKNTTTRFTRSQLSVPKPPLLTPKPAAATSIFSNVKPAFVQPPMRFGNTTQRRSVMPEVQPPTPKRASLVSINSKPTIVQPPMRFGNTSQRRSVVPESPSRGNAAGVSHAVRGIAISRRSQMFR
ncbi:hypothetical protein Mgra_00004056 [Meloidogyne graminicola]|uniref:Uncharacterized protein n=1 Tax=Meloidogyne graminicola TaxID=189291 RepID=A0A8S9ZSK0_9BILA|nr:hypothetical protein Mgra_00004056 [Meloidogyne graminicola]